LYGNAADWRGHDGSLLASMERCGRYCATQRLDCERCLFVVSSRWPSGQCHLSNSPVAFHHFDGME